jgi:hypothetical protein
VGKVGATAVMQTICLLLLILLQEGGAVATIAAFLKCVRAAQSINFFQHNPRYRQ